MLEHFGSKQVHTFINLLISGFNKNRVMYIYRSPTGIWEADVHSDLRYRSLSVLLIILHGPMLIFFNLN